MEYRVLAHANISTLCPCVFSLAQLADGSSSVQPFPATIAPTEATRWAQTLGKLRTTDRNNCLQSQRKMPPRFDALLSGLKGTVTLRDCAAKRAFLCSHSPVRAEFWTNPVFRHDYEINKHTWACLPLTALIFALNRVYWQIFFLLPVASSSLIHRVSADGSISRHDNITVSPAG